MYRMTLVVRKKTRAEQRTKWWKLKRKSPGFLLGRSCNRFLEIRKSPKRTRHLQIKGSGRVGGKYLA